jgi:hypothetical protein
MHSMRHAVPIALAGALALVSHSLHARDGAMKIDQSCVAAGCFPGDAPGFPVTIAGGGSYVLTSDLNLSGVPQGTYGIQLTAPIAASVDLDLAGHTLDGRGSCSGNPVTSCSGGFGLRGIDIDTYGLAVRVHDGSVRGIAGTGIVAGAAGAGSSIENVTVTECSDTAIYPGIQYGGAIHLRNVRMTRNGQGGIASAITSRLDFDGGIVSGNGVRGVEVTTGATIRNVSFSDNAGFALRTTGAMALRGNSFVNNNGGGTNPQWSIAAVRDMGANVCVDDGTCP